jgi:hypothetical protein
MPLIGINAVSYQLEEGIQKRLNDSLKSIYITGLSRIVTHTPVRSGEHRNSWFMSVGAPSTSTSTSEDKSGSSSIMQVSKMPESILGKKVYFTSNAPAMYTLEYGGYPSPVEKGTYDKKSKSYQKLSANGFSKQRPSGWVRETLVIMSNKVRAV